MASKTLGMESKLFPMASKTLWPLSHFTPTHALSSTLASLLSSFNLRTSKQLFAVSQMLCLCCSHWLAPPILQK